MLACLLRRSHSAHAQRLESQQRCVRERRFGGCDASGNGARGNKQSTGDANRRGKAVGDARRRSCAGVSRRRNRKFDQHDSLQAERQRSHDWISPDTSKTLKKIMYVNFARIFLFCSQASTVVGCGDNIVVTQATIEEKEDECATVEDARLLRGSSTDGGHPLAFKCMQIRRVYSYRLL